MQKNLFFSGVFLLCMRILCMRVLMLQIIHMRILSVANYYHLAFFAISIAMFGMMAVAISIEASISTALITGAICYLLLAPVALQLFNRSSKFAAVRTREQVTAA